jgi:hypothetical protein
MIVAYIDNKRVVFDPDDVTNLGWSNGLQHVTTEDGEEYYLFRDREEAGEAAREYWEDLALNDPREFTCLVGEETLIQWGLGIYAGPGSTHVKSLEEWLNLWLNAPEEHFASYDGQEREFKCKHPDWEDFSVAYRHN